MKCAEERVCRRSSAQTTEADRVPGSRVTMNFYDLTAVHSFLISSTSSNMSVSSSSTPINGININDDVLLSILTMNANMFSDKQALNTTRIASQVCRQWRGLLLDTPSLWAKLIDMNGIRCAPSLEWGIELIRRSGTSPLWINANSDIIWKYLKDEATLRFHSFMWYVDNFISGNWYRVQKLVVVGSYHNFGLTRSMLCSPAPQLEELSSMCIYQTWPKKSECRLFLPAMHLSFADSALGTMLSNQPRHGYIIFNSWNSIACTAFAMHSQFSPPPKTFKNSGLTIL